MPRLLPRKEARPRPAAVVALVLLFTAAPCSGMEIARVPGCDGGDVLRFRGDIKPGDFVKFRSQFGGERRITGIELDSPGGSLHEGVRIAMLTRHKRLSTFVAKECDSACAFIFLLGRKRYVSAAAKIGVHAVGNEYGNEDNGTIRDTIYFARLGAQLGIPSSIIGKMVTTKPGRITVLDHADLSALKVIMRDPFAPGPSAEGPRTCGNDAEVSHAQAGKAVSSAGAGSPREARRARKQSPQTPSP